MKTKLIKSLLICIVIFFVTPCLSQTNIPPSIEKKCEKILNKTLKGGANEYGVYCVTVKGKAGGYMVDYLKQKGYATITKTLYWNFEFVEEKELENYICKKFLSCTFNSFKKDCYYHYYEWKFPGGTLFDPNVERLSEETVNTLPIWWNGKTNGKRIEGAGVGIIRVGGVFYILENGTFVDGFPTKNVSVRKIVWGGNRWHDGSWGKISISEVRNRLTMPFLVGVEIRNCLIRRDEATPEEISKHYPVSQDATTQEDALDYYHRVMYDEWVKLIEGKFVLMEYNAKHIDDKYFNYKRLKKEIKERDYDMSNFIKYIKKTGYDSQNILPKAYDIQSMASVIMARNFLYWKDGHFDAKVEPLDKSYVVKGLEYARKGSSISTVINTFLTQSISGLEKDSANYYRLVDEYWTKKYNDDLYVKKLRAEEKAAREKSESQEIDWDRSHEPSGKLTGDGLFSSTYYIHEELGVLYNKRGKSCTYNKRYSKDNQKFVEYVSEYGRYKTFNELVKAFLDSLK